MAITQKEFDLLRAYIKESCGIAVGDEKSYLIESRLAKLLVETGSKDFSEFYYKAKSEAVGNLRDKIVDAMTTNETLWFRDKSLWDAMREQILPGFLDDLAKKKTNKIRIWSAACSTGQEPYSLTMMIDDLVASRKWPGVKTEQFEIMATDISPSALFLAMSGRYNRLAMSRGMSDYFKSRYFKEMGNTAMLNEEIRKRVKFKKLNLQGSFLSLGRFDLVLLRNVAIYFSETFKRELFSKIAKTLNKDRLFILGASESLTGYSTDFNLQTYKKAMYYQLKAK